jgi:NDP-sugar pyrophosphorylase family protein
MNLARKSNDRRYPATVLPVAVILAGGLATRLRPKIVRVPKALVEVADQPFLVHLFELLRCKGITRVVICLGYLGEQIVDLVGDGHEYGLRVEYSFDGPTLLGTAGALKKAAPLLDETFFVLNGDTYLDCDYLAAYQAFAASNKAGLMVIYRNQNRGEPSNVSFANGKILRYDKKNPSPEMQYIDCGLGLLDREVLEHVPEGQPYELGQLFQTLLKDGQLTGYEVSRRYYEIGSIKGITETNEFLNRNKTKTNKKVQEAQH